jgi:hypothetical protein
MSGVVALMALLGKLDDYRGASRFTTWAYKFALLEAGVRLRRRAWQEREVVLKPEAWPLMTDAGHGPQSQAETNELMQALRCSMDACLTDHQREVLVALAQDPELLLFPAISFMALLLVSGVLGIAGKPGWTWPFGACARAPCCRALS